MKKAVAAGVAGPNPKAPDKKGAFVKVQKRTIKAKCGKKVSKKK